MYSEEATASAGGTGIVEPVERLSEGGRRVALAAEELADAHVLERARVRTALEDSRDQRRLARARGPR